MRFVKVLTHIALAWSVFHAPRAAADPGATTVPWLKEAFSKADATHEVVTQILDLGAGLRLPVQVETTNQGNGTLTLGQVTLRLKDKHDDGLVYAADGVLRLDVVPLSSRREPATLIVSGIALHTGEKEGDPVIPESVVYVYQIDCTAGRLVRRWRSTEIELEVGGVGSGRAIRCIR